MWHGTKAACRTQEPGGWEDSARPLGIEEGFQANRLGICGGSDSVNPEFKECPVNIWVVHTQRLSCGWYSIYKNSFVCYLLQDNTVCNCYFVIPGSLLTIGWILWGRGFYHIHPSISVPCMVPGRRLASEKWMNKWMRYFIRPYPLAPATCTL